MLTDLKSARIAKSTPPMKRPEALELMPEIPEWELGESAITREYKFKDFAEAMRFVNRIAEIADAEDHHPDISISYNRVKLVLTTHSIGGLSMNDFIVAAKIDRI